MKERNTINGKKERKRWEVGSWEGWQMALRGYVVNLVAAPPWASGYSCACGRQCDVVESWLRVCGVW